jgi:hypothetical protein
MTLKNHPFLIFEENKKRLDKVGPHLLHSSESVMGVLYEN